MCGTSDEETESNRGSEKHHDSCPVLTLAKRDVCVFYLSNRFYVFLMEKSKNAKTLGDLVRKMEVEWR